MMTQKIEKHTITWIVFFSLFGVISGLAACTYPYTRVTGSAPLVMPYEISPGNISSSDLSFKCPAVPAKAPRNLIYKSVYAKNDPQRATIDPEAEDAYERKTANMRSYENNLLRMSNDYLRTGSEKKAACVLDWLYEWAEEDALLGKTNDMGVAIRQWTLASVASAYAQIQKASLNFKKRSAVESWLKEIADAVISDYPENAKQGRKLNNHLYWAAWAVTITGVALNNHALYDWGIGRVRFAISEQLQDDGTLPLEMARGKKALHYHLFAAVPLIMVAETGARNGDDLYETREGILHRFIHRILEGLQNPYYFEDSAGETQSNLGEIHHGHLVWMEAYHYRFPSPPMAKILDNYRPIFLRRTGGDMTFLYMPSMEN